MRKGLKRTIRISWRVSRTAEAHVEVFAPAITLNLGMVDLRLRKAGLGEIRPLLEADGEQWFSRKAAQEVFDDARAYVENNPGSIPFSDILSETLPQVLEAFQRIPPRVRVRFQVVE